MPKMSADMFKAAARPKVIAQWVNSGVRPTPQETKDKTPAYADQQYVWTLKPLSYVPANGNETFDYIMEFVYKKQGKFAKTKAAFEQAVGKTYDDTDDLDREMKGKFIEYQFTEMFPAKLGENAPEYLRVLRIVDEAEAQAAAREAAARPADGPDNNGTTPTAQSAATMEDVARELFSAKPMTAKEFTAAFLSSPYKTQSNLASAIMGSLPKTMERLVADGILTQEGDTYSLNS